MPGAHAGAYRGDATWRDGSGSDCVDSAVNAYPLDGSVPRDGTVCS
ncbi:alpha/beta hydrolase [Streptomyces sp. NRRL S-340]